MRQPVALARAQYERFRSPIHQFAKFAVIGVAGVVITNAVYDLLYIHLGLGPVTSTTIATIVATIASYLGNRYWSFRDRQRTGVLRETVIFTVLNGIAVLVQDATVAFNYYLLHLGHDKLAGFIALNTGIVLATLFRFWSYRRFVWVAPPAREAGDTGGRPRPADRPPQTSPPQIAKARAGLPDDGRRLRADSPSGHRFGGAVMTTETIGERNGGRGLTSEQVWRAVANASFAVLSHVTPGGEPRSSGVVYKASGRRLVVAVAPGSWKARHVAADGRVAVTVLVRRGGILSLVVPIPPATVSFHGTAVVHPAGSPRARSLLDELGSLVPADRRDSACVVEIIPAGAFRTFGVGVPLRTMLHPAAAQARVPVAPDEGVRTGPDRAA